MTRYRFFAGKGGVGKTTLVCLMGYYLAEMTHKKVLLFEIFTYDIRSARMLKMPVLQQRT